MGQAGAMAELAKRLTKGDIKLFVKRCALVHGFGEPFVAGLTFEAADGLGLCVAA